MDLVHEIIPAGRLGPLLDESLTGAINFRR